MLYNSRGMFYCVFPNTSRRLVIYGQFVFDQGWVNTTKHFNFAALHCSYSISEQECELHCLSRRESRFTFGPVVHWVNLTSLMPYEVWVGVAGISGFLVLLTELILIGEEHFWVASDSFHKELNYNIVFLKLFLKLLNTERETDWLTELLLHKDRG